MNLDLVRYVLGAYIAILSHLVLSSTHTLGKYFICEKWEPDGVGVGKHLWGVQCGQHLRLTTLWPPMSQLSKQCGIFNISRRYRPPRPVMAMALNLLLSYIFKVCS
jgi:hypothetical protein